MPWEGVEAMFGKWRDADSQYLVLHGIIMGYN
jgi:hypothetical protein